MKANKYLTSFIVIVVITILCHCSPAPMLQSPRVKSNISFGVSGMWDKHNGTDGENIYEIHPLNLKFGFFNRVSISGIYIPYSLFIRGGDIKIFINEHGKPSLFKNVSYALFSGIKVYGSDLYSERNAYIGTIFATRHRFNQQEIELILQPSYFNMKYERTLENIEKRHQSKADGMQINFGTIYTPFNSSRLNLEITMGAMYRYINNNKFEIYYDESQKPKAKDLSLYSRWVIQTGVILNIKLKGR